MPKDADLVSLADATAAQARLVTELRGKPWLHGVGITIDPSNARSYAVLLRVDASLKRSPPPELANYEETDGVKIVVDWRHNYKAKSTAVSDEKTREQGKPKKKNQ